MKNSSVKYLTKEGAYFLHIGCNVITPESRLSFDGSWNARFSRYPLIRKLLWKLRIIDKEMAQYPWSKNILAHDVNKGLFFPGNSVDGIYASHLLEHFSRSKARFFVQECYRVLKAGGNKACGFSPEKLDREVYADEKRNT